MTSIVNQPPQPLLPVTVDFYFEQAGPPGTATYDGDIYPYPPLPGEATPSRYEWGTTPVFLAVEFHAEPFVVEGKVREHVVAPPGVTILGYFWDFGDGYVGYGPTVTHTYEVVDPDTEISLTVLDSLGREWSTSKALNLVFVDFGYTYMRIRGQNVDMIETEAEFTEGSELVEGLEESVTAYLEFASFISSKAVETGTTVTEIKATSIKISTKATKTGKYKVIFTGIKGGAHHKRQEVAAAAEKVLTVEGMPTRYWLARAGKPVREEEERALSSDRPTVTTHFYRSATDISLTSDVVTRTRNMVRHGSKPPHEDIALTSDAAIRSVHQKAHAADTSLTTEGEHAKGKVFHAFQAALSFAGKLIPIKL